MRLAFHAAAASAPGLLLSELWEQQRRSDGKLALAIQYWYDSQPRLEEVHSDGMIRVEGLPHMRVNGSSQMRV
jgi:hypothetical protein